jgi:hypothetical protein
MVQKPWAIAWGCVVTLHACVGVACGNELICLPLAPKASAGYTPVMASPGPMAKLSDIPHPANWSNAWKTVAVAATSDRHAGMTKLDAQDVGRPCRCLGAELSVFHVFDALNPLRTSRLDTAETESLAEPICATAVFNRVDLQLV